MIQVELKSWKNCKDQKGTFGFRLKIKDRDRIFSKVNLTDTHKIIFFLPREKGTRLVLPSKITDSFWKSCPEFRFTKRAGTAADFKEWMRTDGSGLSWPYRQPHKYITRVTIDNKTVCFEIQ